jgi:uncharacterized membrane protein YgdD (TMEM256/DUF423 family)
MNKEIKNILVLSSFLLMLAVLLGAFGAHGLEKSLNAKSLKTFEVGVRYQFYHGLALLLVATLHTRLVQIKPKWTYRLFIIGILLFSFNCYLYAVTQIKVFAYIVPLGGVSFILGWLFLFLTLRKEL